MPSVYQVPNQCPHGASSALQRHIAAGESPLRGGLPDPVTSRVQHLCKCGSRSLQTDPTGKIRPQKWLPVAKRQLFFFLIMGLFCFSRTQAIITLILATDMARHGEILDSFKQKVDNFDFTNEEHVTCVCTVYTVSQSNFPFFNLPLVHRT